MPDRSILLEQYQLITRYRDGCWQHQIANAETGPRLDVWTRVKCVGKGNFGTLMLAKGRGSAVRAIKEVSKTTASSHLIPRELHALITLQLVPTPAKNKRIIADMRLASRAVCSVLRLVAE